MSPAALAYSGVGTPIAKGRGHLVHGPEPVRKVHQPKRAPHGPTRHAVVSRSDVFVFRSIKRGHDVVLPTISVVTVIEIWLRWKKRICDPYRPERHYMRGPGPKWREKHAANR